MSATKVGSSPRVRGKRGQRLLDGGGVRIIPARAGQTFPHNTRTSWCSDHPRACGANPELEGPRAWYYGSSPRVRGKRLCVVGSRIPGRIIPARAGQTSSTSRNRSSRSDHPRACGANVSLLLDVLAEDGSSPRVRGKRAQVGDFERLHRIIPARAGQTFDWLAHVPESPDHPRACGANFDAALPLAPTSGSSPRVRGKPSPCCSGYGRARIIPARAGQTPYSCSSCSLGTDHPRACGANNAAPPVMPLIFGSSPRVRGKLSGDAQAFDRERIIPARAGQTGSRAAPKPCRDGSSPRVRGKHNEEFGESDRSRIIPARAGQTRPVVWL